MKTRILLTSMLIALLIAGILVPGAIADQPVVQEPCSLGQSAEGSVSGTGVYSPAVGTVFIEQLPNQVNGLFSDVHCSFCTNGTQVLADNFYLDADSTIETITLWGGYYSTDTELDPDHFTVIFHEDAAGAPGATISTETEVPYTRFQTGVILFGVHEWEATLTLVNPVDLTGGAVYWVEIYNDSEANPDDYFWETGDLDPVNGIFSSAWAEEAPGVYWMGNGDYDMAFRLEGTTGGADTAMFVSFIHMRYSEPGAYWVTSKLRVIDEFGNPVDGAMVDAALTLPGGWSPSQSRMTNPNGTTFFGRLSTQMGTYELCVLDVTAPGYVYDPGMNYETCETIFVGPE